MGSTTEPSSRRHVPETKQGDVFSCLADGERRRLLGILYDRSERSPTERELVDHLVPESQENSNDEDASETHRQTVTGLHHVHLPKLENAGLVERDSDRGTVSLTEHPALRDTGIVEVIRGETNADADELDTLFGALGDSRRRSILDVLSHQFGPIRLETLARELGAKERDTAERLVPVEDVQRILVSLHHVHLPMLSKAGLIEYDRDAETVAYEGHPELRVPWMHSVFGPEFRTSLTGESEPDGIGTIQGRENVVSFGQSLCDRADEELFCLFTGTDMLEAGCLARVRDAADRGVDVYLGTHDPTVRDYVRENVPEVVLWEPETNWLNLPVGGKRVGRLLLADREAVMLGTLTEKGRNEEGYEERSIVGEGTEDALVMMITQLLKPYLDRTEDEEDAEVHLSF